MYALFCEFFPIYAVENFYFIFLKLYSNFLLLPFFTIFDFYDTYLLLVLLVCAMLHHLPISSLPW